MLQSDITCYFLPLNAVAYASRANSGIIKRLSGASNDGLQALRTEQVSSPHISPKDDGPGGTELAACSFQLCSCNVTDVVKAVVDEYIILSRARDCLRLTCSARSNRGIAGHANMCSALSKNQN